MRGGATHGKTAVKGWKRKDWEKKKSGKRREKTQKKKGMHQ